MTTFGLVRHGQTDYNLRHLFQGSSDIPLNDTGREQAHHALDAVPDMEWDVVVSSPLLRARETAEIIAADHGIELGPSDPRLAEIDWGYAEGRDVAEMEARFPTRDFPGREDHQAVADRGYDALEDLERAYPGRRVLVVAHGTIIRFLLSGIAERALDSIPNAALSVITLTSSPAGLTWAVEMIAGAPEHNTVRTADRSVNPRFVLEHRHLTPGADPARGADGRAAGVVDPVSATDPHSPAGPDSHLVENPAQNPQERA